MMERFNFSSYPFSTKNTSPCRRVGKSRNQYLFSSNLSGHCLSLVIWLITVLYMSELSSSAFIE